MRAIASGCARFKPAVSEDEGDVMDEGKMKGGRRQKRIGIR